MLRKYAIIVKWAWTSSVLVPPIDVIETLCNNFHNYYEQANNKAPSSTGIGALAR